MYIEERLGVDGVIGPANGDVLGVVIGNDLLASHICPLSGSLERGVDHRETCKLDARGARTDVHTDIVEAIHICLILAGNIDTERERGRATICEGTALTVIDFLGSSVHIEDSAAIGTVG